MNATLKPTTELITKESSWKEYIEALVKGEESTCPFCGEDDDIDWDSYMDDGVYTYKAKCQVCGTEFSDVYELNYIGKEVQTVGSLDTDTKE